MNKQNTKKNVYELTQERLRMIFNEFDNIYVSFSGGKDSGILLELCIDYIRKNNLNRKIGVFHMDYEIQYRMTIDYVTGFWKPTRIFWKYTGSVCLSKYARVPPCTSNTGVPGRKRKKTCGCVRCPKAS